MYHSAVFSYAKMLFKYCHDFFDALIADAFDLADVFLNFTKVDRLAVFFQQLISVRIRKACNSSRLIFFIAR